MQKPAAIQYVRPGSYIHVDKALASTGNYAALTLECWVRLFKRGSRTWQGVLTQHTFPGNCGFGLFISPEGKPHLYFGNGGAHNAAWVLGGPSSLFDATPNTNIGEWHHLVAVFENGNAALYVDGVRVADGTGFPSMVTPGAAPLRIGAYGQGDSTAQFLDGDIAMPVIYRRALSPLEVLMRFNDKLPTAPTGSGILGCWPLDEEGGSTVRDIGPDTRTGVIVNGGTWMIGGPGFNAQAVGRFDAGYDPATDSDRGHGLRLSSWDIYDCGWDIIHSFAIPADAIPGIYVGRISVGGVRACDVTFLVKSSAVAQEKASVLMICSTSTWLAYTLIFEKFSLYHEHPAGQFAYKMGLNVPWSVPYNLAYSADPYATYSSPFGSPNYAYSHLVRAERFFHTWLEKQGIAYDVVCDHEVDANPGLLDEYKVVVLAGHSEYWTKSACDALKAYVQSGGKLINASGNTLCWRVSFANGVMECRRKVPGSDNTLYGEQYHEHDGATGGSLREVGSPGWRVVGTDTIGFGNVFMDYEVVAHDHDFFTTPEATGLAVGDSLGTAYAVGHEYDAILSEIPQGGLAPRPLPTIADDYNPVVLAKADFAKAQPTLDEYPDHASLVTLSYDLEPAPTSGAISHIIDWPRTGGGRVFSIGSINAGRSLHEDPKMAALCRNALHHMGVVDRLNILSRDTNGWLKNRYFDGANWYGAWDDLHDGFAFVDVVAVQSSRQNVSLFGVTTSGAMRHRFWNGTLWSAWDDISQGIVFDGKPAAVSSGRNRLHLFARGQNGRIYWKWWDGTSWQAWVDVGGAAISDPAAVVWQGKNLSLAFVNLAGNLEYRYWMGQGWSGSTNMGGNFLGMPTMYWWQGRLYICVVDLQGVVQLKYWTGNDWTGWIALGGTSASQVHMAASPTNEFYKYVLHMFCIDPSGSLNRLVTSLTPLGQAYQWSSLGSGFAGDPSIASHRGGDIHVVATGTDNVLRHGVSSGLTGWSEQENKGSDMMGSPLIFRSFKI